ncbi:hypothetical protein K488DRAFT_75202 [Vararia minispora EC-137]|uniref:Uncharacterized protein n=1 Tax=Vararia minispora EC-137 TaxID=1314806 RepID=A0ACB8Q4J5_9AGAM|nr:hypothetical protein K488DRAFT_75202 [Vararia minispora EC-137]
MASGVYVEDRELEAADPLLRHQGEQMRQAYERVAELERSYLDTASKSRLQHNNKMRQVYEIAEVVEKAYGIWMNSDHDKGIDELAVLIYNAGWRDKEVTIAPSMGSGPTVARRMNSEARVEELVNKAPSVYMTPQMDGQQNVPEWHRRDAPPHMKQVKGPSQRDQAARQLTEGADCDRPPPERRQHEGVSGGMNMGGGDPGGGPPSNSGDDEGTDRDGQDGNDKDDSEDDSRHLPCGQHFKRTPFMEALHHMCGWSEGLLTAPGMSGVPEWVAATSAPPNTQLVQKRQAQGDGPLEIYQDTHLERVEKMLLEIQDGIPLAKIKGLKVSQPDVKYDGQDDTEVFERWTAAIVRWFKLVHAVGPDKKDTRVALLGEALEGNAAEHYYELVESPSHERTTWTCREYSIVDHLIKVEKLQPELSTLSEWLAQAREYELGEESIEEIRQQWLRDQGTQEGSPGLINTGLRTDGDGLQTIDRTPHSMPAIGSGTTCEIARQATSTTSVEIVTQRETDSPSGRSGEKMGLPGRVTHNQIQ